MAGELAEELKDLTTSVAYVQLDQLHKDGTLSANDAALFKTKYAKLHEFVLQTYENEQRFLLRAKELSQKLMSEKIKLEKTLQESQEDQTTIEQLQAKTTEVQTEYEIIQDREMMLQLSVQELEHEVREKEAVFYEKEREREATLEPKIQREREENEQLQREIDLLRSQKEEYQSRLEAHNGRIKHLENQEDQCKEMLKGHEAEYGKIKGDPDRINKQAEKFGSAVDALSEQQMDKKRLVEEAHAQLEKIAAKKKGVDDERSKLSFRLSLINDQSKMYDQAYDAVKERLDREKNIAKDLMAKRVQLDHELDDLSAQSRAAQSDLGQGHKQFDKIKRQFKRTQNSKEAVDESLIPLKEQKKEIAKNATQTKEEIERQKTLLTDIQGEVDLFIGAYLKQETLEKDKKDEYDAIVTQMDEMQKELKTLKEEEQKWRATFKTLASQREKLARDASTAHRLCRETQEEVAMKQLEEEDLKKKHQEISQKQKEFCTMYEVVKNERNKYTTHIQKSSQHLSEMKEKLKILQNEVEILKMESAFKDKKLQNIKQEAQSLKTIHDNLQNQKTSIGTKNRVLNVQVEQSVIETDKLNSIINAIEKEMVKLRREYEQGVETRNFTGTQLIDRNDELCILWEKSNILEKLLKKGEGAMLSKNEEIRGLNIDLKEVERQLVVVQKKIPEIPKLVDEHVRMRAQVDNVRKRTDELSKELENPDSHLRRWQKLKGEDLDADSLRKKIQDLEERLHTKNEALLEKELIHEEVTALSEKLRQQALAGRQGTMDLSQKVNTFQSRIKDVTRKMMATVSELSMYQATSHKLQMERDDICEKAVTARERLSHGQPPTDSADGEFDKMMQVEAQKEVDKQASAQRKQEEEIMNSNYTRTTAEPRVNAYIPEDDRGLPKAYGNNAPFKPTVAGSSMRHTRKPNPKQIEI